MYPFTFEGESGFSFCNLTEINASVCDTKEKFFKACRIAAILGTFQAAYTWDKYLPKATIEILTRDALLGVSMTGMCSNPSIAFNPEIQREGARIVKETNKEVAAILGINEAARTACIKPKQKDSNLPDIKKFNIVTYNDVIDYLKTLNIYDLVYNQFYSHTDFINCIPFNASKNAKSVGIRKYLKSLNLTTQVHHQKHSIMFRDRLLNSDGWYNDDFCRYYIKQSLKTRLILNYGNSKLKTNPRYVIAAIGHPRASKSNQVKAHIILWELHNRREFPNDCVLVANDGNYLNLELSNFTLRSKQEHLSFLSSGNKNYFFIDGSTAFNKYGRKKFWSYKASKFKKGKNCVFCSTTEKLVVHHIVNYKLFKDPNVANEDNNLIVCCNSCHSKLHWGDLELLGLIEETQYRKSIELLENLSKECRDIKLIENSLKTISSEALKKFKERSTTSREAYTVSK